MLRVFPTFKYNGRLFYCGTRPSAQGGILLLLKSDTYHIVFFRLSEGLPYFKPILPGKFLMLYHRFEPGPPRCLSDMLTV